MAEKVSVKTASAIFLLSTVVLALCACVVPVNVEDFLDELEKNGVIASTKKKVILFQSDQGLVGENGKITGLNPNSYYKIEVIVNKVPVDTNFVYGDGTWGDELKNIRKVPKGEITGLTNDVTYRVKSAKPYTNDEGIRYFTLDDTPSTLKPVAKVSGGAVTISESRSLCYFTVSPTIDVDNFYEVINVGKWDDGARTSAKKRNNDPVDNISNNDKANYEYHDPDCTRIGIFQYRSGVSVTPAILNGKSIMELPAVGTVNDYVFVQDIDDGSTKDFYYLTVTVDSSEGNGNITITPPTIPANEEIILTYGSGNTSIVEGAKIQISLGELVAVNKTIKASGGSSGTYKWYYYNNNTTTSISSDDNIVIGNTAPLITSGTYSIIVEKTVTTGSVSVVYSKWFVLEIKQ